MSYISSSQHIVLSGTKKSALPQSYGKNLFAWVSNTCEFSFVAWLVLKTQAKRFQNKLLLLTLARLLSLNTVYVLSENAAGPWKQRPVQTSAQDVGVLHTALLRRG